MHTPFVQALAVILAPALLGIFFVATSPPHRLTPRALLVWYLLAQITFWPPALVAKFLSQRFHVVSLPHMAALMGILTLAMTTVLAAVPLLLFQKEYGWRTAIRDELAVGAAAAGAFALYVGLTGWPHRGA